MSPPLRGNIEQRETRKTKKGSPYEWFKIGGETYTIWDRAKVEGLSVGDTVDFSFEEKDGGFKNLTFITKTRPEPSTKDVQIARAVALKAATELVTQLGATAESRPNSKDDRMALALEVTDIAALFDSFLQNSGPEEEHPSEPGEPDVE